MIQRINQTENKVPYNCLTLSAPNFRLHLSSILFFIYLFYFFFCFLTNYQLERKYYVKLKVTNREDPDEMAHIEPFHLDLRHLTNPIIIAFGRE